MRIFKPVILVLLLALLFVGNVGIKVFTHHCTKEGDLVSYVFSESGDNCPSHAELEEKSDSCCSSHTDDEDKGSETSVKQDGCCSDLIQYFQLDQDYANESGINDHVVTAFHAQPISVGFSWGLEKHKTPNYVNPPPVSSKELRITKQVWII